MDTWEIIVIIATILGLASSIGYFYDKFAILSRKEKDIVKGKPLFSLLARRGILLAEYLFM